MLNLAQELVLLAVDDDGSVSYTAGRSSFTMAVIGACFIALNQVGRIDVDLEAVRLISSEPVGDDALDSVLELIASHPENHLKYWLDTLSLHRDLISKIIQSLVDIGILEEREKKFMWVLKTRRYPIIDGAERKEAKVRIVGVLLGNEFPTPDDTVLIGMARVGGLLDGFLSAGQIAELHERLDEVSNLDLIGRMVEERIREEQEVMAQALMFVH